MSEEKKQSFEDQMRINRFELEKECERNSVLYAQFSRPLAEAKTEVERQKILLNRVKAKISAEVRVSPPKEIVKVTEPALTEYVTNHKEVIDQEDIYLKALGVMNNLQSVIFAILERRADLEMEVKLWVTGYFDKPSGSIDFKRTPKMSDSTREATEDLMRRNLNAGRNVQAEEGEEEEY